MKSMTGYGASKYQTELYQISIEIKGYNSRYLDIRTVLPTELSSLEQKIKTYIGKKVLRGKVDVAIQLIDYETQKGLNLDEKALSSYIQALNKARELTGISGEVRLDHLLMCGSIFKPEPLKSAEEYEAVLMSALEAVVNEFDEQRRIEGAAMKTDIVGKLDILKRGAKYFIETEEEAAKSIKEGFLKRYKQLAQENLDTERLFSETAILIAKSGINEEIVRLDEHINAFENITKKDGSVGKKLDFFCQEIGRELNSIASKSTLSKVIHGVVECKDAIECLREQLRNVE